MFCGWGHTRDCPCLVCEMAFRMSRKKAYRMALAMSKRQSVTHGDDMLKKPVPGQLYGVADVPFDDPEFKSRWPTLYEYLITERWQDGSMRTTATLSVFMSAGCLKVVINDRDNNRSAFFNGATLLDTIQLLENSLASETTDWKSRSAGTSREMKTPF